MMIAFINLRFRPDARLRPTTRGLPAIASSRWSCASARRSPPLSCGSESMRGGRDDFTARCFSDGRCIGGHKQLHAPWRKRVAGARSAGRRAKARLTTPAPSTPLEAARPILPERSRSSVTDATFVRRRRTIRSLNNDSQVSAKANSDAPRSARWPTPLRVRATHTGQRRRLISSSNSFGEQPRCR
jgi:hypothetical protein